MSNLNINFDDGYRDFVINGDESRVLRISVADFNVLTRMNESKDNIMHRLKGMKRDGLKINALGESEDKAEESVQLIKRINKELREEFDTIFYEGASDIVFGRQNPLSVVKGVTIYENFMRAFAEVVKPLFGKELELAEKHNKKYKGEYDRIASEVIED